MDRTDTKKEIKVYIYMSYDNMLKVVMGRQIKLLSIQECNDLYEFMPSGKEGKGIQKKQRMKFISFSSDCNSCPMWGHYADKNRGACLEFTFPLHSSCSYINLKRGELEKYHILDINVTKKGHVFFPWTEVNGKRKDLHKGVLFEIQYRKERQDFDFGIMTSSACGDDLSCCIDNSYITKDSFWEYEKELRMLFESYGNGIHFFKSLHRYLTGIILGVNCGGNEQVVKKVVEALRKKRDRDVEVVRALYSEDTFEIKVPGR